MSAVDPHNLPLYSLESRKDHREALEIRNKCFDEATTCGKSDLVLTENTHITGDTEITGEITEIIIILR